ncbi:acyl carrier protein [Streptomyces tubbatahanensis]|uniref:Acyl carrier protein n=1 Tax=Streptomyces tubbatahanensis TaxID=2923272 RepID=A0ABY3XZN0_9ACTN|nr:acyl carrier protein [Streptomyces tubbatahanensis]UNS99801.1 acyl carrier protein [Streptomyces tubbatahanensis]
MKTQKLISDYIVDVWMGGDAESLEPDTPLTELNIIDSMGIFDLVGFLQREFSISVPMRDVTLKNFRSVRTISAMVDGLRQNEKGDAA